MPLPPPVVRLRHVLKVLLGSPGPGLGAPLPPFPPVQTTKARHMQPDSCGACLVLKFRVLVGMCTAKQVEPNDGYAVVRCVCLPPAAAAPARRPPSPLPFLDADSSPTPTKTSGGTLGRVNGEPGLDEPGRSRSRSGPGRARTGLRSVPARAARRSAPMARTAMPLAPAVEARPVEPGAPNDC